MDLIRLDSNPNPDPDEYPNDHRQSEDEREENENYCGEDARLRVKFKRFGLGEKNRSNFAVEIDWSDVRSLVRQFIEMGHPEALHLQRIIRLANAIEDVGWNHDYSPYAELWQIVPPNSN